MIIIGLGTGRSGTTSLASLLCRQKNSVIFHEMNPSVMRFDGTPAPVINMIKEYEAILAGGDTSLLTCDLGRASTVKTYNELCAQPSVSMIGDIAFYYLHYVDLIASLSSNVRFVCMKRDKAATVNSWIKKSKIRRWRSRWVGERLSALIQRIPFYESKNFWVDHDGTKWQPDPVWDKCFPSFNAATKEDAISQYYDMYYDEAEKLAQKHSNIFRVVHIDELNSDEGQNAIMDFCGMDERARDIGEAWVHRIPDEAS